MYEGTFKEVIFMRAILQQKHRRQARKHEMPGASKAVAERRLELQEQTDFDYGLLSENASYESRVEYDYTKEIGHDH